MKFDDWLQIFAGIGIFFFSLRLLHTILSRDSASRFKLILTPLFANPVSCILVGLIGTTLTQASSITIITGMALVSASLITLEQGFLIMLGAMLGTTVKLWVYSSNPEYIGPALIAFSSLALIFFRRPLMRNILESVLAIGLCYFGLSLITTKLEAFFTHPSLYMDIFAQYSGNSLSSQMVIVILGIILTVALQSSSVALFFIGDMLIQNLISFPAAAALALGANIGTTSTALIACIEFNKRGQQLAIAHLIVKSSGVLITLFFFPMFISGIDLIIPGSPKSDANIYHLAAVHTVFNVLNLLTWVFLASPMLRFLNWLSPDEGDLILALPGTVRKMIASYPDLAFSEADRQIHQARLLAKGVTDHCFLLMSEPVTSARSRKDLSLLGRDFENIEEGVYEILLRLNIQGIDPKKLSFARSQMRVLNACGGLHTQAIRLQAHLEQGLFVDLYTFPPELRKQLSEYQKAFDAGWLTVFFDHTSVEGSDNDLHELLNDIEMSYFNYLKRASEYGIDHALQVWIYEALGYVRQLSEQLLFLNRLSIENRREEARVKG